MTGERYEQISDSLRYNCIIDNNIVLDNKYDKVLYDSNLVDELNKLNNEVNLCHEKISEYGIQLDFLKAENEHMGKLVNENHELKRLNKLCEEQVIELRRLVHLATKEYIPLLDKELQEKWRQELHAE